MEHRVFKMELGGRELVVETGKYAEQASGACIVRCDETVVLVTATAADKPREGIDFFPLSIEYEEKMYSVGRIPGGFIKREGKPSEKAVLACRLTDRPLRPLFPKGYRNDVQIIITTLSTDPDNPPEVYGMIGSSVALSISGIPFMGPTGSVNVGMIDGKYIINPNSEQRKESRMALTVSGTKDAIMMVEAGASEVTEAEMLEAILFAHDEIKRIVDFISEIKAEVGKPEMPFTPELVPAELFAEVDEYCHDKVVWSVDTFDRSERDARQSQVKEEVIAYFAEKYPDDSSIAKNVDAAIYDITKKVVRSKIINDGIRPDGRGYTDIRPIWCEAGILPRTHGSAVFTRGQTQAMTLTTLAPLREGQNLDGISEETFKRYIHHYNMPPYSTGEAKPLRSTNRREIGHGNLAERALLPVLPSEEEFPYAIRTVSEVLSSNGSTSQASICGSTLSLMDAGVPIKAPVAGAAMGLIKDEESGKVVVLTDIQGLEDFLGDMDFKVAGTAKGITAIQMDIKIKGIDRPILERALSQALDARLFILGKMTDVLPEPRTKLSKYAPKIIQFSIDPEKIREVIGPGGKVINKIIEDTGVKIDIEDDGHVYIATADDDAAAKARRTIEAIATTIEVGNVYLGKVTRIIPIGAFVEIVPGKEGMIHISKLANRHVKNVEDEVNIGDEVLVRVCEIDRQGRINLNRRDMLPKNEKEGKKESK